MENVLFNPAFWMPAAGLLLAVILFVWGNSRVKTPVRNAGVGLLVLVFAWMTVAYFVQTGREKCVSRTRAIVAAVEGARFDELRTLLDTDTRLEFLRGQEAIAAATETAASSYGLKRITILNTDVIEGVGTVDVNFTALLEGAQATTSTWRFEYTLGDDGISLVQILPVSIGNVSMEQIRRSIPGR